MCSRNGRPVESLAAPWPSRFTFTRICVSLVLRVISACLTFTRSSQRFAQCREQYTVFVRRADVDAQAIVESRVKIAHQHALALERLVGRVGVPHAHKEEVRLGRKYPRPRQGGDGLAEQGAIGANPRRLLFQHVQSLE